MAMAILSYFQQKKNSIRKTNSDIHNEYLKFTAKQKKIVKLLKELKNDNKVEFPSILIEHLVKKAFQEMIFPQSIFQAFLKILKYISDNISSIRIIDPANSNNVISDLLSHNQKEEIAIFMYETLKSIQKDKRNLLDYFEV